MAGVSITKYLTPVFSAIKPKKGLKSAGILRAISKNAAIKSDISSFAIRRGRRGAKNDENTSCAKCAKEMVKTLDF